jgi:hypothetical protein
MEKGREWEREGGGSRRGKREGKQIPPPVSIYIDMVKVLGFFDGTNCVAKHHPFPNIRDREIEQTTGRNWREQISFQ